MCIGAQVILAIGALVGIFGLTVVVPFAVTTIKCREQLAEYNARMIDAASRAAD